MNNINSLEQVPRAVGLILDKMEALEKELADLKSRYENAPILPDDHNEFMRFPEAFKFLKITRNTLHVWVRNGKIPYSTIGSTKYFKKADLENYNKFEIKKPKGLR